MIEAFKKAKENFISWAVIAVVGGFFAFLVKIYNKVNNIESEQLIHNVEFKQIKDEIIENHVELDLMGNWQNQVNERLLRLEMKND